MKARVSRRIWLVATVGATIAAFAAPSAAQALSCGQTLTHSVKLKSNLDCSGSAQDGLIVGKNGITINLNGHSVIGSGHLDSKNGIYSEGFDNVRLINGTVKNFSENVYFYGGARITIDNVHAQGDGTRNAYGFDVEYVSGARLNDLSASNVYAAFYIEYGSNAVLTASKTSNARYGVYFYEQTTSRASGVRAVGIADSGDGGYVYSSHNILLKNVRAKGPDMDYGFYVDSPYGVRLDHVRANGANHAGAQIDNNPADDGFSASISGSTFNSNGDYGAYSDHPGTTGGGNTALDNPYGCYFVRCNG